jgi:malic enzyme
MLLGMANDPIVFAMANPDPEIEYNCYQAQEVILYGD